MFSLRSPSSEEEHILQRDWCNGLVKSQRSKGQRSAWGMKLKPPLAEQIITFYSDLFWHVIDGYSENTFFILFISLFH